MSTIPVIEKLVKEACMETHYGSRTAVESYQFQIAEIVRDLEDRLKRKEELLQDALRQYAKLETEHSNLVTKVHDQAEALRELFEWHKVYQIEKE